MARKTNSRGMMVGGGVRVVIREQMGRALWAIVSDEGGPNEVEDMARSRQIWSLFCLQDFQMNHPLIHMSTLHSLRYWPV